MYAQVRKSRENTGRAVANSTARRKERRSAFADGTVAVLQAKSGVVQRVNWIWDGNKWNSEDGSPGAGPRRPGAYEGEVVDFEEPQTPISLNLGAGQNPMSGLGTINLEYVEEDARKGLERDPGAEYVLADATKRLPFRAGIFDAVHAINPYLFNPVSSGTMRVMNPGRVLRVTGNAANKYAKNTGSAKEEPERVGLQQQGLSPMAMEHAFGEQAHSGGGALLNKHPSSTRSYAKTAVTLEEAARSQNPELREYYEIHSQLELMKMEEREQGYMDDYADDNEYLDAEVVRRLSELRRKYGRFVSGYQPGG